MYLVSEIITYADLTEDDILVLGNASSSLHVWNLKTRKRMPSSNIRASMNGRNINEVFRATYFNERIYYSDN